MIVLPMLVYALLGGVVLTTRALGINCRGQNCDDSSTAMPKNLRGIFPMRRIKSGRMESVSVRVFFYVELS